MTKEQEFHLEELKKEFCSLVDVKYRVGVKKHGGDIWEKDNLLDEAINEAIDLVVYLLTLKNNK